MKINFSTKAYTTCASGFTLVEMVLVIVIIGIIAGVLSAFIGSPVLGFLHQERRSALTDSADLVMLRMARDLRSALPNSVRSSGDALEMLITIDGDRYRTEPPGLADDRLEFGVADTAFNTLAPLAGTVAIPAGARLAIYPLGTPGNDPYLAADGVMTPSTTTLTRTTVAVSGTNESRITLSAAHVFPTESPSRRVFLVEGPVSYLRSGRFLYRYAGYAVQAVQPSTLAALDALAPRTLINDNVAAYNLSYSGSGAARRNAVAQISLTLEDQNEQVRLVEQVHIDNSP